MSGDNNALSFAYFPSIFSSSVAKSLSLSSVAVLALVTVSMIELVKSECCRIEYDIEHVCLGDKYEKPLSVNDDHVGIAGMQRSGGTKYWVRNEEDKSEPKCLHSFCADGDDAEYSHCGVGKCNWFGTYK